MFNNRYKKRLLFDEANDSLELHLPYDPKTPIRDRISDVMNHMLSTVGLLVTSLGDDTFALFPVAANHNPNEITGWYDATTKWEVELKKSLVTFCNGEYLREQPHPCYVVKLKCYSPELLGEFKLFIAACKPTSHVLSTLAFPEGMESRSDLIKAIGNIAKLLNLNLHPNLEYILTELKPLMLFNLFTEDVYYVPVYKRAEWVKAGKPANGSNYHELIKSYEQAVKLAGREAEWIVKQQGEVPDGKELLRAIGLNWTTSQMEDYDAMTYMSSSRLIRMIKAMHKHDATRVKKINNEVFKVNTDYFSKLNKIKPETPEDDVSDVIVQLSKRMFV